MATKLKDLPIKYQLIIIIFVIALVSLWLASTAFVLYDRHTYKKNMVHELTILSRIVANRSATAVAYKDPYQVRQNLDALATKPSVISACITDEFGSVVAMFSREHLQDLTQAGEIIEGVECLHGQTYISRFHDGYLDLIQPVLWEEAQRIGELHIRVDLHELNKRFKIFTVVIMLIVVISCFIAIALSSQLQAFISAPLLSLTRIATNITQQKDYSIRAEVNREDELGQLIRAFNSMLDTIEEQNQALLASKENLEDEVEARTAELKNINRELEAFTYSVSHDLRSPLRSIEGFSTALKEDCIGQLDSTGEDYLERISKASQKMGTLIDSLLYLSRVSRQEVSLRAVDLAELGRDVAENLRMQYPSREFSFSCPQTLVAYGDKTLLMVVLENLLGNARKYSAKVINPTIELGVLERNSEPVYFVKDNGVGFDMKYAEKLFGPFQRLHAHDDFEGLGVGLATVARIVHRHGGEIWAEAMPGIGATFYFTLGAYE